MVESNFIVYGHKVTDRTEPIVVLLYNNDNALESMAEQYDKFAKGFQDFMTIAAVNCG